MKCGKYMITHVSAANNHTETKLTQESPCVYTETKAICFVLLFPRYFVVVSIFPEYR